MAITRIQANHLAAGDKVQQGNKYSGFHVWSILGVAPSRVNNRKIEVTFEVIGGAHSGAITSIDYGKTAEFFRITA